MSGLIYFVKCRRYVKVGFTADMPTRLSELQVGNPFLLDVVATLPDATMAMEKMFHEALWRQRGRGEWFRLDKRLEGMIDAINAGARPVSFQDVQYLLEIGRDIRRARRQQLHDQRRSELFFVEIDDLNRTGGKPS